MRLWIAFKDVCVCASASPCVFVLLVPQETIMFLSLLSALQGKYEQQYEKSEEFQKELKLKVRELLTEQEWRRRKMQMRVWYRFNFSSRLKWSREWHWQESDTRGYLIYEIWLERFLGFFLLAIAFIIWILSLSCRYQKKRVDWKGKRRNKKRCGKESVNMRRSGKEPGNRGYVFYYFIIDLHIIHQIAICWLIFLTKRNIDR